jgi:hypothetical protein
MFMNRMVLCIHASHSFTCGYYQSSGLGLVLLIVLLDVNEAGEHWRVPDCGRTGRPAVALGTTSGPGSDLQKENADL